ncbi:MAG: hypothetical protein DMG40_02115 [Acidobacteria bacterium]|nr:MAG: hypothetical protein DMG40_02115 [Acidobacteriota bacterium]
MRNPEEYRFAFLSLGSSRFCNARILNFLPAFRPFCASNYYEKSLTSEFPMHILAAKRFS